MRRVVGVVSAVLVAALAGLAAIAALVLLSARRPEPRPADAIVVLGAAQYNGRPSPVFKARLDHAVHLYRRGLAPVLVLTGGVGKGDTLSEGEVGRRYAAAAGVPDSAMLVDRRSETSAESVGAAARLLRERGLRSALLVSDPFHMLRLEVLARRAGLRALRAPAPGSPIAAGTPLHLRYILRETALVPAAFLLGPKMPSSDDDETETR